MKKILTIKGMRCENCAKHVYDALHGIDGIEASVDLANNTATLTLTKVITDETLQTAIVDAGYTLVSVDTYAR
ncbi:MAG: heavy-metal-associated domain-containing protein [Breznakia sp.]